MRQVMYIVLASGAQAGETMCKRWAREFRALLDVGTWQGAWTLGSRTPPADAASSVQSPTPRVPDLTGTLPNAPCGSTPSTSAADTSVAEHVGCSVLSASPSDAALQSQQDVNRNLERLTHASGFGASSSSAAPALAPETHEFINAEIFRQPKSNLAELLGHSMVPDTSLASGVRGLLNFGNTCYLNSLIVALAHLPLVRGWASEHRTRCGTHPKHLSACTACCLATDIANLFDDQASAPITPRTAQHRAIWNINFAGQGQHCAHEAFCTLFAACDEVDVQTVASWNVHANAADAYTTPWWQMQGFMTTSTTHCRQCNYKVCKYEQQNHLSIPLSSHGDMDDLMLEQLLSASLGREELDDSDDRCQRCNAVGRVRNVELVGFPKTLVLHLKRWSQNVHGGWVKNQSHVEFPFEMDLSSSKHYKLRSLVVHSGHAGGGHYTAFVRTDEHFWKKYNDAALPMEVSFAAVLQAEAYMLMYEAVPSETR
jgi:hypothetical protein